MYLSNHEMYSINMLCTTCIVPWDSLHSDGSTMGLANETCFIWLIQLN